MQSMMDYDNEWYDSDFLPKCHYKQKQNNFSNNNLYTVIIIYQYFFIRFLISET